MTKEMGVNPWKKKKELRKERFKKEWSGKKKKREVGQEWMARKKQTKKKEEIFKVLLFYRSVQNSDMRNTSYITLCWVMFWDKYSCSI